MDPNVQIPFYLNENIVNNLYTVLIEKFAKINTVTNRRQSIINITTPLCNIMDEKYIEGDLKIQFLNEFARQKTEERVSIGILIFLKTKEMLSNQHLVKNIDNVENIKYLKKDDYVELNCKVNKNPLIKYVEENLKSMQMQTMFMSRNDEDTEYKNRRDIITTLKEYFTDYGENNCLRYITDEFLNSKTKFVVPLEKKYMSGSLEYLEDGNVSIFGKIINIQSEHSQKKDKITCSNTCLDYLNKNIINTNGYFSKLDNDNFIEDDIKYIEILPICIYI